MPALDVRDGRLNASSVSSDRGECQPSPRPQFTQDCTELRIA